MKIHTSTALLVTTLTIVKANIPFTFVQPTCNATLPTKAKSCLAGQYCLDNGTCIAQQHYYPAHDASVAVVSSLLGREVREDGRCGSEFGNATCEADGEFGGCCSGRGWCGRTVDHCARGWGCQSGCLDAVDGGQESGEQASTISTTGASTSLGEPILGSPTASSAPSGPTTIDGTCGANNNGTLCGDFERGSCCSLYGFCGRTSAFCGPGCQSGPCEQGPSVPESSPSPAPWHSNPGSFDIVADSGVPVMHAALLPNGKVAFLDKVEDFTKVRLPGGGLAYSAEYDAETRELVALRYATNAFCSGGAFLADGTLVSVGGNGPLEWLDPSVGDGFDGLRFLKRSVEDGGLDGGDWVEPGHKLDTARWYASAQTMPDGSVFVASGSLNGLDPSKPENNNPTYEILDASGASQTASIPMDILVRAQPYYMYPVLHLLPDGNLFILASTTSELFSPSTNTTLRTYPDLPGPYRTYPNAGTSALLPLHHATNFTPSILVCGGGAYQDTTSPTTPSCGLLSPLAPEPSWDLSSPLPAGRGSPDLLTLPDGNLLLLNGFHTGADGFLLSSSPATTAVLYSPSAPPTSRWSTVGTSQIPRMYHSIALVLRDGTVLIAGSNPNEMPVLNLTDASPPPQAFATEFRIEIFTPPYLSGARAARRPGNVRVASKHLSHVREFEVRFVVPPEAVGGLGVLDVVVNQGGFVTHAMHMGQRMVVLEWEGFVAGREGEQVVRVRVPGSRAVVPPGPYVVFVVLDGVPGVGVSVLVG